MVEAVAVEEDAGEVKGELVEEGLVHSEVVNKFDSPTGGIVFEVNT